MARWRWRTWRQVFELRMDTPPSPSPPARLPTAMYRLKSPSMRIARRGLCASSPLWGAMWTSAPFRPRAQRLWARPTQATGSFDWIYARACRSRPCHAETSGSIRVHGGCRQALRFRSRCLFRELASQKRFFDLSLASASPLRFDSFELAAVIDNGIAELNTASSQQHIRQSRLCRRDSLQEQQHRRFGHAGPAERRRRAGNAILCRRRVAQYPDLALLGDHFGSISNTYNIVICVRCTMVLAIVQLLTIVMRMSVPCPCFQTRRSLFFKAAAR